MFDSHIQYYAYNNIEGDEFGVGYLGNKDFWVGLINRWERDAGNTTSHEFFVEDWDDLDFRGCELAEVVPDDNSYVVSWMDGEHANTMQIDKSGKIIWLNNPQNKPSIPRWVSRLKNQLLFLES